MTGAEIRYAHNRSGAADILQHLNGCSAAFVPPLDSRVALPDYAAKLACRAERFEAWNAQSLVGLVALYCPSSGEGLAGQAFVSNVSVLPSFTRLGIARRLLSDAIGHARPSFSGIGLEADRRAAALDLYRECGFVTVAMHGDTLTLRLSFG